jgi:glycolate oxidase
MSLYHTDARQTFDYTLALGLTARLYSLGARFGGRPYGVGLWNTPYLSQIFSSRQLTELRARKKSLDPVGRFNPGKLYQAPFPLWPAVSKPGMAVLSMAYRIRGGRKHHQEVSRV